MKLFKHSKIIIGLLCLYNKYLAFVAVTCIYHYDDTVIYKEKRI